MRRVRLAGARGRKRWSLLLLACASLFLPLAPERARGEEQQKSVTPQRIILTYNSANRAPWKVEELVPYVAHLTPEGRPDSWFFDTVLVLGLNAPSGRGLCPGFGAPSTVEDWQWYLAHRLFGEEGELVALDRAVAQVGKSLNAPSHRVRVIIAIPYPDPKCEVFGEVEGKLVSLATTEGRLAAVDWYLTQVAQGWTRGHFAHLTLAGYYWIHEEVPAEDEALLPQVAARSRARLLPLYWIPWFGARGAGEWRRWGFSYALQQPNYFFYEVGPERLREAADFARAHGMGVELELDQRLLTSPDHRARYRRYLDAGVEFGFMQNPLLAWYDDSALLLASRASDPEVRSFYDDSYAFTRGAYGR